ncbi:MAG: zinc metalloprotease HtpX [Gammaproteobacteria bacterium]|nr:zinc metalloprotease HtpX [Gammaproteobacteria bacterium]
MEMLSSSKYRFRNLIHSVLLLSGMSVLLALVGWSLAGEAGLLWAISTGLLLLFLGPPFSVPMILRLYKARVIQPEQAPDLYTLLQWIAERAELKILPSLFYVPGKAMNAFTLGSGNNIIIAVSDAMLRNLTVREMAGVLAHEVSHIRNRDLWVMMVADVISRLTGLMAMAGYLLLMFYLPVMIFSQQQVPWLGLLILVLAPNLSALFQLALSRTREYNADLDAAEITSDPLGLASALKKIEHYQGQWLERALFPNKRVSEPSLLRSHPESVERIKRLKQYAQDHQWVSIKPSLFGRLWPDSYIYKKTKV